MPIKESRTWFGSLLLITYEAYGKGGVTMTVLERLRDKANSLPMTPGVYIMKNADDKVIYVGKSKKLKNRVTS